ncbi:cobalamin biosynthesis protein CbiG [Nocardia transvalensis]|uniref:Cobalamin biosynthesis protein CbiG n=1 Tax=Nocardia transvalensis TaxID=37333 RepID=A0A7W9P8L1_9NOCA|nr:cobalamin biosynthesis protein [Nocardia transvalensis]MBB5911501.1 cobalamin biosynthesis protein CbiG [Nocardia transvalensis]
MSGAEFVAGIGFRPGVEAASIVAAVRKALGDREFRCLATVDRRAEEPGLLAAAAELGVPVVAFPAEELSAVEVPNPAARTTAAIGTPSVAEAAALCASAGGHLVVPKRVIGGVTVAVARCGVR